MSENEIASKEAHADWHPPTTERQEVAGDATLEKSRELAKRIKEYDALALEYQQFLHEAYIPQMEDPRLDSEENALLDKMHFAQFLSPLTNGMMERTAGRLTEIQQERNRRGAEFAPRLEQLKERLAEYEDVIPGAVDKAAVWTALSVMRNEAKAKSGGSERSKIDQAKAEAMKQRG